MNVQASNPFTGEDGKPRLLNSVVAFVDILGFSEYCKESFKLGKAQQELDRLHEALSTAYSDLKQKAGSEAFPKDFNMQIRIFTDCLVLGYPIPTEGYKGMDQDRVMSVIFYLSFLQGELIRQGYLVRGSITIGEIHISGDIVFGPALIQAVEGEKKTVFPRIALYPEAYKVFEPLWSQHPIHDLAKDSDGTVFIDFLNATVMIAYPDDRPFTEFLEGSKMCIVDNLTKFSSNPHIRAKYEWAATYHNSFCSKYPDLFGEEFKIPAVLIAPPPIPWIATAKI